MCLFHSFHLLQESKASSSAQQVFLLPVWKELIDHTITFLPLDTGKKRANTTSESFYNILVAALFTGQRSLLIFKFLAGE